MAAHNIRTAIPVITNAAAPEVNTDEVSTILAILDTALDAHSKIKSLRAKLPGYTCGDRLVAFFADKQPHAEYTLTLWASANQLEVRRHTSKYANGRQIRSLDVVVENDVLASVQWPSEPQPVSAVEVTTALRSWRPSDAGLDAPGHHTDDKVAPPDEQNA